MGINSNKVKDRLLGMSHGAANHKLRKAILFQLVQETSRDICFQCGQKILTVEEFSIEHMMPWQAALDPKHAFFNLKNIAFSHLQCNVKAGSGNPKGSPENLTRGRNVMVKLTTDQVKEIKALLREGVRQRIIARAYGLHHSTIQAIQNGESWKDIC